MNPKHAISNQYHAKRRLQEKYIGCFLPKFVTAGPNSDEFYENRWYIFLFSSTPFKTLPGLSEPRPEIFYGNIDVLHADADIYMPLLHEQSFFRLISSVLIQQYSGRKFKRRRNNAVQFTES
jgi:hypothetical protein